MIADAHRRDRLDAMSHSDSRVRESQTEQSLSQRITSDLLEDILGACTSIISPGGVGGQDTGLINPPKSEKVSKFSRRLQFGSHRHAANYNRATVYASEHDLYTDTVATCNIALCIDKSR